MWELLYQRYRSSSTFSKSTAHSSSARPRYNEHAMQEYVAKWELMSTQLASLDAPIDEGLLVTMFVEHFGDRSISPIRAALSALLNKYDLTWESATARLLQDHISRQVSKPVNNSTKDFSLASYTQKSLKKKKDNKNID